jgi:TolB protein
MHHITRTSLTTATTIATILSAACSPDAPVGVGADRMNPSASAQAGVGPKPATIAFASGDEGSRTIYTMNPDGTGRTPLTSGTNAATPAWSSDRRQLAFVEPDSPDGMMFTMNRKGARLTPAQQGSNPAWSPDGKWIALDKLTNSSREIMLMSFDYSGYIVETINGAVDEDPTWSPDSKHIAFVSMRTGAPEIFIKTRYTAGETQVTNCGVQGLSCSAPAWSPVLGDDRILFAVTGAQNGLFTIRSDGTGLTAVKTFPAGLAAEPTWSPDATQIAFTFYVPGTAADIYRINADGTGLMRLTTDPRDDVSPAWSR